MIDIFLEQDTFSLLSFFLGVIGTTLTAAFGFIPIYVRWRRKSLDQDEALFEVTRRLENYKNARKKEIKKHAADIHASIDRLTEIDPERFIDNATALYDEGRFEEVEILAFQFAERQQEAFGMAAGFLSEQLLLDSAEHGKSVIHDALRFAKIGLAADPSSKRLQELIKLAERRVIDISRGDPIETLLLPDMTDVELNALSQGMYRNEDYALAEIAARRSVPKARLRTGERSLNYAAAISQHASCLQQIGEFVDAVRLQIESLDATEAAIGKKNLEYARRLGGLGTILAAVEQYSEAERRFLNALDIISSVAGKTNAEYAIQLWNMGELKNRQENYQEAVDFCRRAAVILEEDLGKEHSLTQQVHASLNSYLKKNRHRQR